MWSFQWLNSRWHSSLSLSASDRGLAYGDGVFETFRITQHGTIPLFAFHESRLKLGLNKLLFDDETQAAVECAVTGMKHALVANIDLPTNDDNCTDFGRQVRQAQKSGALIGKLIVSRGTGQRGYDIPVDTVPTIILQLSPAPGWQSWLYDSARENKIRSGITLLTPTIRLAQQPALAGVKHCNRLEQVLARQQRHQADDVLLQDSQGHIIETSMANVCMLKQGQWLTPELNECGVAGVARQWLLDRHAVQSGQVRYDQLSECDAMMICNSVLGILPIVQIDHHQFAPAAICSQWQNELESLFR